MRRTRRRAVAGRLGWALGLVVLAAPSLAEAQLFPNRTIRRERTPCAAENPYYKTVRQNYFGYYPTCWSRFPAGWGCPCPNPELPNFAASLAAKPIQPLPDDAGLTPTPPGDDAGPGSAVPGPLDDRPGAGPPPLPGAAGGPFNSETTPRNPIVPPGAGGAGSLPVPDPVVPPQTSRRAIEPKPEARPATTGLLEVPRISPPDAPATALIEPPAADPAASSTTPAEATLTGAAAESMPVVTPTAATDAATLPPANEPVSPPLPDASTPPAQAPGASPTAMPAVMPTSMPASVARAMALPPTVDAAATGKPAQAPQKKGILTGLFDRQGRKRR